MNFLLQPWQLLLVALSGWVNQRQQEIIEFQNAQIQALLKKLGRKRVLLSDEDRRRLAVQGKALGRKTLLELTTLVTPDTILRWHRELVARKWDHTHRRKALGRPRIRQIIVELILRFARENPTWGYDRIQGTLANVGYSISDSTVRNILKAHRAGAGRLGQPSSRPTGTSWGRSTLPPSRSGRAGVWSPSTCCSSWS